MSDLYLVEPTPSPLWYPFSDCRPICELRAGAWLIRERWEGTADGETRAIFGPDHLCGFVEEGVPPVVSATSVDGPALIASSAFAPSGVPPELTKEPSRLVNDGETVGWWVPEGHKWDPATASALPAESPIEGVLLNGAYDVITATEHLLAGDTADFTHEPGDEIPEGCIVIGDPSDVVILGAAVEPGVVFDVRKGALVLEQHTHVRSGSRLVGPLYVGPGCEILGGEVYQCSIGPRCKVRGEIHGTVLLGFANKGHDGFVGHSVVGRWVNLGAGTTTSNLKNTYGPIRLRVGSEQIETGCQFVGTLFGDHAKTAIGTFFNTGSVVGSGANVFGASRPPKYVPPMAWGFDGERMSREGFLTVAERVLPRRQVVVTEEVKDSLTRLYDHVTA